MTPTLKILTALTATLSASVDPHSPDVNRILDQVGGISIIGLDGRYIDINEKYANICGYEPAELLGKQWQVTIHPDDIPIAIDAYQKMQSQGEVDVTIRGIKKDGTEFRKELSLIRRNGLDGKMNGHYCLMNEI